MIIIKYHKLIFLFSVSLSAESQTKFITKEKVIALSKKYGSYSHLKNNYKLDALKKNGLLDASIQLIILSKETVSSQTAVRSN